MAEKSITAARTSVNRTPSNTNQPAGSTHPVEQPLLHFGLRHLFWFIAVVSTLLAGLVSADGITALVLLLAALVVAGHLFATALGSRLRADADKSQVWQSDPALCDNRGSLRLGDRRHDSAPRRSPWHGRGSTALPWLPALILCGAVFGGTAGTAFLALTVGHRTSTAGIVVGAISAAVLGGWFMFLGGSFYGIFRHGLRDALAEQQKDEAQKPVQR